MDRIPVTVLTGFLGSGKTTLLKCLMESPTASRTALLINEFGEVSIDHLLVKSVSGNTVVLQNGCVCCSVRSELRAGLRELIDSRGRDGIPAFDRVVIETTGLADPAPVVQTLVADPMLRSHVQFAGLVSAVDALNGREQLATFPEAARQTATADYIIVTKTDLSTEEAIIDLETSLGAINPAAVMIRTPRHVDSPIASPIEQAFDATANQRSVRTWRGLAEGLQLSNNDNENRHAGSIQSFVYRTEIPIDWSAFSVWLSFLVHRHGKCILRIKGLLDVPETAGPVCLNVVQHFVHPPVHLDAWPDDDVASRLVFIVQGLDEAAIRRSLTSFLQRAGKT